VRGLMNQVLIVILVTPISSFKEAAGTKQDPGTP